jgi:hypothetical protein
MRTRITAAISPNATRPTVSATVSQTVLPIDVQSSGSLVNRKT